MFNPDLEGTFKLFSAQHLYAASFVFFLIFLMIFYSGKIRGSKYENIFRYTLGALTLLQELTLNIVRIVQGEWMISTSLPLQLCGLAVVSSSIVLITKNKKLFTHTFFIMMIGATLALITPGIEKSLGFPHFRFFQFFTSHGLIVINYTFILFVWQWHKDVRYKTIYLNLITFLGLAVVLLGVNLLTGGNYMYIMGPPYGETAITIVFGPYPKYILNIFAFGIPVIFHLFYIPFFIRDLLTKKQALTA